MHFWFLLDLFFCFLWIRIYGLTWPDPKTSSSCCSISLTYLDELEHYKKLQKIFLKWRSDSDPVQLFQIRHGSKSSRYDRIRIQDTVCKTREWWMLWRSWEWLPFFSTLSLHFFTTYFLERWEMAEGKRSSINCLCLISYFLLLPHLHWHMI